MVGEALGGQLQREHVAINPGAEVAPEDEGRNGDDEAKGRVVERHRNAVLPPASEPAGACEPKISIMPITVPSRPSSGAAEAMVASAGKKRSSLCAALRPAACSAARISSGLHCGLLLSARQPAASTSPTVECCAS